MKHLGSSSLLLVFILSLFSCSEQPVVRSARSLKEKLAEPLLKKKHFKDRKAGVSIDYPLGWEALDAQEEDRQLDEEGAKLAEMNENDAAGEYNDEEVTTLLSVQKDPINSMSITRQLFKEEYPGQYMESNAMLTGFIYESFAAQGVKVDTASMIEEIAGKRMYRLDLTIYDQDGSTLMIQQNYSTLHQGQDISISLTFDNEQDRQLLRESLESVSFFPRKTKFSLRRND